MSSAGGGAARGSSSISNRAGFHETSARSAPGSGGAHELRRVTEVSLATRWRRCQPTPDAAPTNRGGRPLERGRSPPEADRSARRGRSAHANRSCAIPSTRQISVPLRHWQRAPCRNGSAASTRADHAVSLVVPLIRLADAAWLWLRARRVVEVCGKPTRRDLELMSPARLRHGGRATRIGPYRHRRRFTSADAGRHRARHCPAFGQAAETSQEAFVARSRRRRPMAAITPRRHDDDDQPGSQTPGARAPARRTAGETSRRLLNDSAMTPRSTPGSAGCRAAARGFPCIAV